MYGSGIRDRSLIANNGLLISGRDGLRLECVSNSSQSGLGTVTTPAGLTLSPGDTKQGWSLSPPPHTPGLLSLITSAPITSPQQGIYTCSLPDSNGDDIELNVGIYPNGFNGEHVIIIQTMTVCTAYRPLQQNYTSLCLKKKKSLVNFHLQSVQGLRVCTI